MAVIERYGRIEGKWIERFNRWTPQSAVVSMWNSISEKYIFKRYAKTRTTTISWKAIYNNMVARNVFKKEHHCSDEEWKHSVHNTNYSNAQFVTNGQSEEDRDGVMEDMLVGVRV